MMVCLSLFVSCIDSETFLFLVSLGSLYSIYHTSLSCKLSSSSGLFLVRFLVRWFLLFGKRWSINFLNSRLYIRRCPMICPYNILIMNRPLFGSINPLHMRRLYPIPHIIVLRIITFQPFQIILHYLILLLQLIKFRN